MASSSSRPAPPPIPSHSSFLKAQIRSSLAHLRATSELSEDAFQQIDKLLSTKGEATQAQQVAKIETEEERLGKNNAMIRKTLLETPLLENSVEMALSIAIPSGLVGSVQQEAILKLVTKSKIKIVNAITDPSIQKKTSSGAWLGARGAHTGLRKGFNAAGQSVTRRREESKVKGEQKKMEKQEQKAIKEELKREREEIIRKKQMEMLNGGDDDNGTGERDEEANLQNTESSVGTTTRSISRDASLIQQDGGPSMMDIDGDAMVSVQCSQLTSQGSVAATTTFSPWPGLLLTSTLVATNDDENGQDDNDDDYDDDQEPIGSSFQSIQNSEETPPRRLPPLTPSRARGEEASTLDLTMSAAPPMQDGSSATQSKVQPPPSSAPPTTLPPPPLRATTQRTQQYNVAPMQNEVIDTTDAKQKSWTKKLGL